MKRQPSAEYAKALAAAREVVGRYAHVPQNGPERDPTAPADHVLHFALTAAPLVCNDAMIALAKGRALTDPRYGWPFTFDEERLAAALERAATDAWYFDGLAYVAALCLSRGGALPEPLLAFACGVLAGTTPRPKRRAVRWAEHEAPSFWREVAIRAVQGALIVADLPVTHNRAKGGGETVAAAVAAAMYEAGRRPFTEQSVVAAWNDRENLRSGSGMAFSWRGQIRTK